MKFEKISERSVLNKLFTSNCVFNGIDLMKKFDYKIKAGKEARTSRKTFLELIFQGKISKKWNKN